MQAKKKPCAYHNRECYIYKNFEGKQYCKEGWYRINPSKAKIAPRSNKRAEEEKLFHEKHKPEFLKRHPKCQARLHNCESIASEVHHKKGRIGNLLNDIRYFLAVCRNCHTTIERNPEMAKKLNLSLDRLAMSSKEHEKSDYNYDIVIEEKTLRIIDLDLGNRSVTNNIENILLYIEEFEEVSLKDYFIEYQDSDKIWTRVIWDGKNVEFKPN